MQVQPRILARIKSQDVALLYMVCKGSTGHPIEVRLLFRLMVFFNSPPRLLVPDGDALPAEG